MFSAYSEVLVYANEKILPDLPVVVIDDRESDYVRADILPSTSAFGGFKLWPHSKSDFILIAECSEISGPNPIYTIPKVQHIVSDLTALCIKLLSADYQEFSSNKCVTNSHTQVLMLDLMIDVHVAVNHFTLYDAEARGFVRPLCIAYITRDKHKLIQLSKPIFKSLLNASLIIQHSNRQFCQEGFQNLEMDLQLTKSNLSSLVGLQNCCENSEEMLKVYNNIIDSCIEAISEIMNSIKCTENSSTIERLIKEFSSKISLQLGKEFLSSNCESQEKSTYKPKLLKVPIQQNFDKRLRNLFTVSPCGILVAFYHLYLTHKYFSQKCENLLIKEASEMRDKGNHLQYGACLNCVYSSREHIKQVTCLNISKVIPIVLDIYDEGYSFGLDDNFLDDFIEFLNSQNVHVQILDAAGQDSSWCENGQNYSSDIDLLNQCVKHILPLSRIWEIIDNLKYQYPDAENITLKVLKAFDRTESILFSLLTHSLLIILYSTEEEFYVRMLLQVFSTIIPTSEKSKAVILHHMGKPRRLESCSGLPIVTYSMPCDLSDLIPPNVMPHISVLDLTTASYCGSKYAGYLLDGVNEKVKRIAHNESLFPYLISVLSDVELQVKLWQSVVASSATNSFSTMYLLQKGYTRYDIKIVETLSRLSS